VQRRLVVVALAVAAVAAVATAALGFVLADVYRPQDQGGAWRNTHLVVSVAFLVGSATAAVVGVVSVTDGRRPRVPVLVPVCALVATVAAAVTLLTRSLVAWDFLGLRSVTVGTDVSGYWTPAFDDEVVIVLVGATEATPGEYAVALLAHLAAPVLGAAALVVATRVARRSLRRPQPDEVAVAPVAA
jgi:hypothetical protein